jgi:hypothetical protein
MIIMIFPDYILANRKFLKCRKNYGKNENKRKAIYFSGTNEQKKNN